MEQLLTFFSAHGLVLTIIAVVGIVVLGILKYAGAFSKYEEKIRHYFYFGISVGFSVIASVVYLLIIKQFEWSYFFAITGSIYALNQTFYSIFSVTSLNDLCKTILTNIINWISNRVISAKEKSAAKKLAKAQEQQNAENK